MNDIFICPSPEELAAFYDRKISENRARRIRDHLTVCRKCAGDIKDLPKYLRLAKGAPVVPGALERYTNKSTSYPQKAAPSRRLSRRTVLNKQQQ
jgi:hypothetical protein